VFKFLLPFLALVLWQGSAMASATRTLFADTIKNSATTNTYTMPAGTGTVMISSGIIQETPSGSINGSNVTFTLANAPFVTDTATIYLDGIAQIKTTDYSISSSTITMVTAPATGQSLSVSYSKY
jgi:hypothetical protein